MTSPPAANHIRWTPNAYSASQQPSEVAESHGLEDLSTTSEWGFSITFQQANYLNKPPTTADRHRPPRIFVFFSSLLILLGL